MTVNPSADYVERRLADVAAAAAPTAAGLPTGGTAGDVLLKTGTEDYADAWTTLSGDVTVNSSGLTAIGSGVIVDLDIAAGAAINHAKLASMTAGRVLLGNASNVPTATALSGDVTVNSSGVVTVANDAIGTAKIAQGTAGQVLMTNGTPDTAWTTLSGDVTVNSSGLTAIGNAVIVKGDLSTSTGELAGAWSTDTTNTGFINVTGGNLTRRWRVIGKTLDLRAWWTAGTATASGIVEFTLPASLSMEASRAQVLLGFNGTTSAFGVCTILVATPTRVRVTNAGGNFAAGASLTGVVVQGTIEVA